MAERPIVSITHLTKGYRRGDQVVEVLRDITLAIPEGDFIALMGPSGSGKSTLLNLIAGLDLKSEEEVLGLLPRLNSEMGKTIIMVSHDGHAVQSARHVTHLEKGELLPEEKVVSGTTFHGEESRT